MNRISVYHSGRLAAVASLMSPVLLLIACTTLRQLDDFKAMAGKGEYAKIAQTQVDCDAETEGCNQTHLIKGDACYRLAKAKTNPAENYLCAAAELEQGIKHTKDWKALEPVLGKPEQYYENFCESLRLVRDNQTSNDAALPYNNKLADCARDFSKVAGPLQPAAVFFRNNSILAGIRLNFAELKEQPGTVCPQLSQLQQEEQTAAAQQTPYTANHRQLLRDIYLFTSAIPACTKPN